MDEEKTVQPVTLKDFTVKPLFERRNIDNIVAAVLALLSIFGVSALLWDEMNVGFTVVFCVMTVFISAFLVKKGDKLSPYFLICGILSLVCSCSFFMTSNGAVKFVALLACIVSAVVWFNSAAGKTYSGGDYGLLLYFLTTVYRTFDDITRILKSLFAKGKDKSKVTANIFIGIACAIPAVLIIVPILSSADDAFSALISSIFDDFSTILQKIVLGLAASILVISLTFSVKYNTEPYKTKTISAKINNATVSAFLSVVCSVYLIYIVSQLAYFFSAFSSILPKGYKFTYAQYARRGFFELCVISVINLLFIFAAIIFSEKKDLKISLAVKIPATFIVGFTFLIIFTAISKMVMYIDAYGCTALRIFTSVFMIWLFILFACILIRIYIKQFDFLKVGLITALIFIAVLGIGNVNRQIADYNYNTYISASGKSKKIDVEYLADLGDEGIPYLYKLTKAKDSEVAGKAITELNYKYMEYYKINVKKEVMFQNYDKHERVYNSVGKYSLPKTKAYEVLEKYAKENHDILYQ